MTPETLQLFKLVLDCYRAPLQNVYCADPQRPLPDNFSIVLESLAESSGKGGQFDAAGIALGVNAIELRAAGLFFIKQILFAEHSDHYRVLGLTPGASLENVRRHYRLLIRLFHPDKNPEGEDWDQQYAPRINEAYNVLKRPEKRQSYDAQLLKRAYSSTTLSTPQRQAPPPVYRQQSRHFVAPKVLAKSAAWQRHPKLVVTGVFLGGMILVLMTMHSSDEGQLLRETEQEAVVVDIDVQEKVFNDQEQTLVAVSDVDINAEPLVALQELDEQPNEADESADTEWPEASEQLQAPELVLEVEPETEPETEPEIEVAVIPPKKIFEKPVKPAPKSKPKPVVKPVPQVRKRPQPIPVASVAGVAELSDVASRSFITSLEPEQKPKSKPKPVAIVKSKPVIAKKPVSISTSTKASGKPVLNWEPKQVLENYADLYQVGDLIGVLNLFTPTARINEGHGLSVIAEHYNQLFKHTSDRRMSFTITERKIREPNKVTLLIQADYRALSANGGNWESSLQNLEMHIVQMNDGLFISQLTSSKR